MSKTEHSPLPWGVDIGETVKVRTVSGHAVCDLNFVKSVPMITRLPAVQNAWFIATACNAYYDNQQAITKLVEAWDALPGGEHGHKAVEAWLVSYMAPAIQKARALIAKHKSEPPAQEIADE